MGPHVIVTSFEMSCIMLVYWHCTRLCLKQHSYSKILLLAEQVIAAEYMPACVPV